ncbi:MAG: hypothetical protein F9K18_09795 [Thermoanaerobaculia bacterium]|nr:MAG: hypothetical protein F9K18_09795 [Thermoanaerobaculia bacterium]
MSRLDRFPQFAVLALLALGLAAPAAVAQDSAPTPFTYVAEWNIARDQWQGFNEWAMKNHKPILERLSADGALLDWGFYETYVHEEGSNTHGLWWSSATFAGIERARAALLKAPFHPASASGAHHDYLLRTAAGATRSGATAGGFLYVNRQELRPGQGKAWREMWDQQTKPVLDEMVAKGAVASYGIQYEDVHTASNAYRYLFTVSTSPEAEDEIEAAYAAARAKLSDAEGQAMGRINRDLTVPESHRDYMARITAAWFK